MSDRRSRMLLGLLPFLLLIAAVCLEFGIFLFRPVAPPEPKVISVPLGAPFAEVAKRLGEEGVVASSFKLKQLARLRGATRRIKAGEYDFSQAAIPGMVLDRLVAGDVRHRKITIPEGLTLKEIAARLDAEGFGDAQSFLGLAKDPSFVSSFGIPALTLEGYLFPETYTFGAGISRERLICAMVRQFRNHLSPDLLEGAANLGLDAHQLVTLASIIQKEAGSCKEMPLISAVFHNRLKRGMPLQADPTVIYGIEDFDGNLTRQHLAEPTPYNTYRTAGLPPGPIANPGECALRAAAFPEAAGYLYFVARGDGTHVFSNTLKEHNKAVLHYQLRR